MLKYQMPLPITDPKNPLRRVFIFPPYVASANNDCDGYLKPRKNEKCYNDCGFCYNQIPRDTGDEKVLQSMQFLLQ